MSVLSLSSSARRVVAAAVGVTAALGVVSTAAAATETRVDTGDTLGKTTVYLPDNSTKLVKAGSLHATFNGVAASQLCVQIGVAYSSGTNTVDVTARDMTVANNRAMAWVLTNVTPTSGTTVADKRKGVVAGVAMWILSNQVREANPTTDASINADVANVLAQARAAAASPATLSVTATAPAAGITVSDLTVSGRPGAVVDMTIPSGQGTLSAASVTLDASGKAQLKLTRMDAGESTVTATTQGEGTVFDVVTTAKVSQSMVIARPSTLTASAKVTFRTPPTSTVPNQPPTPIVPPTSTTPTPPATPTPPPVVTTPAPPPVVVIAQTPGTARLAIDKVGPARATAGKNIRYTVKVTNRGNAAAQNVRISDRLPSGLTVVSSPGASVARGVITWKVSRLAPGASRTVVLVARSADSVSGRRVNTATASADGVASVRDTAATLFNQVRPAVVMPAVTG